VRTCSACGRGIEDDFRFCPGCGAPLRVKLVEHFRGAGELGDGWLRVSAYLSPPQHVRFSIWRDEGVESALSLRPGEARRLAAFLHGLARHSRRDVRGSLRRQALALRTSVRELRR
jgi:zinc-ribbon domain